MDLLFPPRRTCPFCGCKINGSEMICARCQSEISEFRKFLFCRSCGRFFRFKGDHRVLCSECTGINWPFEAARSVGPHAGLLKQAVQQLKYSGRQSLAATLGSLMADVVVRERLYHAADIIIPVPLSRLRIQERGFNQAELLAKEVGRVLGVVVEGNLLQKRYETPSQAGLSMRKRHKNLRGAFIIKNSRPIVGRKVLLVDDVFTTGSTLSVASEELLKCGASAIVAVTATSGVRSGIPAYCSS
ncbi:MAG TPA: ComF family protein [Clostridia bacterium]|nr:ComF family protein [Clostridia bacterium]